MSATTDPILKAGVVHFGRLNPGSHFRERGCTGDGGGEQLLAVGSIASTQSARISCGILALAKAARGKPFERRGGHDLAASPFRTPGWTYSVTASAGPAP